MTAEQAEIIDQAIGWHVRLAGGSEADWARFVGWLEASAAHAEAYDAIMLQDRAIESAHFPRPAIVAGNDNPPRRPSWLWLAGGSAIAATIAALIVPAMLATGASPYEIATRPGQQRSVALADGTTIELSGGTTVQLDHGNPRVAVLERGEALFHVRHDAERPFTVTTNGITVRDVGTVFNLSQTGDRVAVAVAEGAVMYQPTREAVMLKAGDALARDSDGQIIRSSVPLDSVGGWRTGMLSFDAQSLGMVAATLNRLYALNLSVEGDLSDRPFTGMVRLTGASDRDIPHLAALIGASWRRDGARWILSSGPPPSR